MEKAMAGSGAELNQNETGSQTRTGGSPVDWKQRQYRGELQSLWWGLWLGGLRRGKTAELQDNVRPLAVTENGMWRYIEFLLQYTVTHWIEDHLDKTRWLTNHRGFEFYFISFEWRVFYDEVTRQFLPWFKGGNGERVQFHVSVQWGWCKNISFRGCKGSKNLSDLYGPAVAG